MALTRKMARAMNYCTLRAEHRTRRPMVLCNLTAQFIRSVPDSITDPGRTGGSTSGHTHGAGSYSATSHTHTFSGTTDRTDNLETAESGAEQVCARITHTHAFSGITGSGAGGVISGTSGEAGGLPPYFELAFIMRL